MMNRELELGRQTNPMITVMTYNVGNGRARPHQLNPLLAASRADVVALQELSEDQAAAMDRELAGSYPYRALFPAGFAGKGLLSRFPIRQAELRLLGPERPDLLATINIQGWKVMVINAHPPPPLLTPRGLRFAAGTWREIQALAALALDSDPCLLVGDFNLMDSRREYAYLRRSGLKDVFAEAGRGRGHTLPRRIGPWKRFLLLNRLLKWVLLPPLLRVDYIWRTPSLVSLDAWIGPDGGSDHLPLLGNVALRACSGACNLYDHTCCRPA